MRASNEPSNACCSFTMLLISDRRQQLLPSNQEQLAFASAGSKQQKKRKEKERKRKEERKRKIKTKATLNLKEKKTEGGGEKGKGEEEGGSGRITRCAAALDQMRRSVVEERAVCRLLRFSRADSQRWWEARASVGRSHIGPPQSNQQVRRRAPTSRCWKKKRLFVWFCVQSKPLAVTKPGGGRRSLPISDGDTTPALSVECSDHGGPQDVQVFPAGHLPLRCPVPVRAWFVPSPPSFASLACFAYSHPNRKSRINLIC